MPESGYPIVVPAWFLIEEADARGFGHLVRPEARAAYESQPEWPRSSTTPTPNIHQFAQRLVDLQMEREGAITIGAAEIEEIWADLAESGQIESDS